VQEGSVGSLEAKRHKRGLSTENSKYSKPKRKPLEEVDEPSSLETLKRWNAKRELVLQKSHRSGGRSAHISAVSVHICE